MRFFSTPRIHQPATPAPVIAAAAETMAQEVDTQPDGCSWYDSSFDLSKGLEVSEQDSDLGYQLCLLLC